MRYIEAGALGKLQEIIIRISYILRNRMNKLELAPPCKVGVFCPVWHNIPKGSPELTHRLTTLLFLNQYKFFRNQFNYFLFSIFYHIFATSLLQINVERNIDINLKISDCTSHDDLISTDICIDPDRIVDYKTDCADQYNEMFGQDHSLDDLW